MAAATEQQVDCQNVSMLLVDNYGLTFLRNCLNMFNGETIVHSKDNYYLEVF